MPSPDWLGFRGKTFWDWLQLLIVPVILIAVTFAWGFSQTRSDNKRDDRRIAADRVAAEEARQDAALQAYFSQMSGLMLDKKLLDSRDGDAVRAVARTATLAALRRLNGERRGEIVLFLTEARLLDIKNRRVNLNGAELGGVDLTDSYLEGVNLEGTDLVDAILQNAILRDANLRDAYLGYADLAGADLKDAKLEGAVLDGANLEGVSNLDLGRFLAHIPSEGQQQFFDSQKAFLESLSPRELARFKLSKKKLEELRRAAGSA